MDRIILGQGVVIEDGLGSIRPNDNVAIFGGTGTGKSMSVLIPTLCNVEDSSVLATYAKREIVNTALNHFRSKGYKGYVWNLSNPAEGDVLPDPICYIASDNDVQEIAKQIARGNPEYQRATKFDPYWREASESLITGLIYYVLMTEKNPSMKKVIDLFYSMKITEEGKGIRTTLDPIFNKLEAKKPDCVAVRKFFSYRQLPYVTAGCVRDDLEKAIQNMFPLSVQEAMSADGYVDFEDFATNQTAIFVLTSPVNSTQYCFANLLFGIAIRQLMQFAESRKDGRLPRPVRLFFDDFSCGFPVQNYEKSISTFRAAGISSMMLCQSISQLDATYGEASTIILDNCAAMAYFPGGMNVKTCRYISEMANLPLEEILFMEVGNAVIFQAGQKPKIVPRYDTMHDPKYLAFMQANENNR